MELEKPLDKVTLLGVALQPKEETNNQQTSFSPKKEKSVEKKRISSSRKLSS